MIVYQSYKQDFLKDVSNGAIEDIIKNAVKDKLNRSTPLSEYISWRNSQGSAMYHVMNTDLIPNDSGVAIEYSIPRTNDKRIDFIITGRDENKRDQIIIIELKQWTDIKTTNKDAIVITRLRRGYNEELHPSYRAWTYSMLLMDFNTAVYNEDIKLNPCAYLHNHKDNDVIYNSCYSDYLKKAPAFCQGDKENLQNFIAKYIKYGDKTNIMYRIENGEIRPSKNLADSLTSMIKGNPEFIMIDDQKIVYENALALAKKSSKGSKHVLIVEGGPGTGKSVIAVNLLVAFTNLQLNSQYVTKNSAPRAVFERKLTGTLKKTHISNMFVGSGEYTNCRMNTFDVLIIDEAHRLNEKSGMCKNKGENQIKEIINSSKFSVFFIDEYQQVTFNDIGKCSEIEKWAKKLCAKVHKLKLESQFRCNGSDGYLDWIDNALQIRNSDYGNLGSIGYDFKIIDSPVELRKIITEKNKTNNKARIVAGYCWDWISKNNKHLFDINITEHAFSMRWNLSSDGSLWIISPSSVNEAGCIHTCQGLELDYIGVIVGSDLLVRNGKVVTDPSKRAKTDKSLSGYKKFAKKCPAEAQKKADSIIRNTYRTLLTRGMKGCYVYFTDKETELYFKQLITSGLFKDDITAMVRRDMKGILALIEHDVDESVKYIEHLPLYSISAACGYFGEGEPAEIDGWIKINASLRLNRNMFVIRACGKSMEPLIPEESYCIFRAPVVGSRNGKIVLVQHRSVFDSEHGGAYSIKKYSSKKHYDPDDNWQHEQIMLIPINPDYKSISIPESESESFTVIAEFIGIVPAKKSESE